MQQLGRFLMAPESTRVSNPERQNSREWVTELRPHAIWFLLTLVGSGLAVEIVRWISDPIAKTIVIGIALCVNALLVARLDWLRTRDNRATTRELTILLQRIEKLRKASVDMGPQHQQDITPQRQQREQPRQRISSLDNNHRDLAELPPRAEPRSRAEFEDLTTSPRWVTGEQDAHKQWARLNAAEKAMVRFVLLKGTATAAQLLQFRDPGGSRSTDTCAGVKEKTSFLLGDLEGGLTINPQLKAYLEKIIVRDKNWAHF
jgi:hypothetical protein